MEGEGGGGNRAHRRTARGDSMVDAGIDPHDVVVLRQAKSAENGQIVLAV